MFRPFSVPLLALFLPLVTLLASCWVLWIDHDLRAVIRVVFAWIVLVAVCALFGWPGFIFAILHALLAIIVAAIAFDDCIPLRIR